MESKSSFSFKTFCSPNCFKIPTHSSNPEFRNFSLDKRNIPRAVLYKYISPSTKNESQTLHATESGRTLL